MKEHWIKVEDRLPSDERYVFVFDEKQNNHVNVCESKDYIDNF